MRKAFFTLIVRSSLDALFISRLSPSRTISKCNLLETREFRSLLPFLGSSRILALHERHQSDHLRHSRPNTFIRLLFLNPRFRDIPKKVTRVLCGCEARGKRTFPLDAMGHPRAETRLWTRNALVVAEDRAGLRFYKIRFYKIQHNSIQHNCVYVVVYVCRNACVWVFYLVETNLVETKACRR